MKHYLTETSDVLKSLETSRRGIDPKQAAERLEEHGKNKLVETRKKTIFQRLIDQLKDPMVIILIAAAAVSGVVGEWQMQLSFLWW